MIIVFTARGNEWNAEIDERFGRAEFLCVYDTSNAEFFWLDNREVAKNGHGVGPLTAQKLFDVHADVLITGNGPGNNAAAVLKKAGVQVYTGASGKTIAEAYESFSQNKLQQFPL